VPTFGEPPLFAADNFEVADEAVDLAVVEEEGRAGLGVAGEV
jgi:hypothetical protein